VKDHLPDWAEDHTLIEPLLKEAPFGELRGDGVVVGVTLSIEHIDPICTASLDLTPISFPLLPTTTSHLHALHESLGDLRGHNPSFGPYCAYSEDMPRKIEWTAFLGLFF